MNAMNAPPPLIELLGARWVTEAPVVALAWDVSGLHTGFALGDGTVALATGEWPGGPALKPRQSGESSSCRRGNPGASGALQRA